MVNNGYSWDSILCQEGQLLCVESSLSLPLFSPLHNRGDLSKFTSKTFLIIRRWVWTENSGASPMTMKTFAGRFVKSLARSTERFSLL